jgi:ATP-dependent Clp protease ATP-binding subunit ClpA
VETPLARKILAGDIRDGQEVRVDARNGALTFEEAGQPVGQIS